MNCVRCGDPKQMHIRADGSNIRNAACGGYLERWPEGLVGGSQPIPPPALEAAPAPEPVQEDEHAETVEE